MVKRNYGYTLIEIMVVVTASLILLSMVTLNVVNLKPRTSIHTTITTLLSDLKEQQMKAMTGKESGGSASNYGIRFESDRYILFSGATYNPNNSSNFTVNLDDNLVMENINLPSSTIAFTALSGEYLNFNPLENSFTIRNTILNEQKTIIINRAGNVIAVN
ncbi:hypothetical protein A2W14_03335 [Candidatus Gottesmanbacteria bacterium RBG_16_37_8]|uniref:General secretion pathway GspH domain-containing protein n=1 Tax=Candidatus Gottesmanbacteria bacterium RBG_16_37_8 TaxID=1798371 RepID=A0A1F5YU10_9BACT|nr:MAG: hypothetical protein A2W14_03335 [Candidatus Gottesmanbacteria bacterium RBG_16_37_8]